MEGDKNIIKDIIVISSGSYPYGGAATNRHLSYLRGLAENSINTTLLVISPDNKQSKKSNSRDTKYKGIRIKYTCPRLFLNSKQIKRINYIFGVLQSFIFLLFYRNKNEGKKILLLLITKPFLLLFYIFFGHLMGYKVVHERTEYPFLSMKNKTLKFYLNKVIPRFDGIFVITYALKRYFAAYTKKAVFVLPMNVEMERFSVNKEINVEPYIAYCGSMYTDKDGVPQLIKAFDKVSTYYPELKLYLIGDNSDYNRFKFIKTEIDNSISKERIICTGIVDRDKMPQLLKNAKILALARPDNIQAQGGFPTKLGEYLATGNPVVITDVGEHSLYLTDGISAMIAKPDSTEAFSKKLKYLLDNQEKAKEIGYNGKNVAYKYFDYKGQSDKLIGFLNEL